MARAQAASPLGAAAAADPFSAEAQRAYTEYAAAEAASLPVNDEPTALAAARRLAAAATANAAKAKAATAMAAKEKAAKAKAAKEKAAKEKAAKEKAAK